jgi:hypothetical protein
MVVQTNGANNLPIMSNNSYTFATLPNGTAFAVTVLTQPTNQLCTVTNGTGTINGARFTNVIITCVTQYTISANVTGLAVGASVVLWDNGGNALTVTTSGTYPFTTQIAAGGAYAVTVHTQPTSPAQICTPTAGTGVANSNVTVAVACVTQYTISASVSGLNGANVVLWDNGGDALTITSNGTFPFATKIAAGGAYAVTVHTQPTGPAQFCRVTAGTGVANSAVTVVVGCKNTGKYVFVGNEFDGAGTIGVFAITASTGAIAAANGNPGTPATAEAGTDANPVGLGVDPTGPYLYVANSGISNFVMGTPNTISGGNDVTTFTIGGAGALAEGTPAALTDNLEPTALAFDPAGAVYVGNNDFNGDGAIVAYNPAAGVLGAQITNSPSEGNEPLGLAVDSTHKFLFSANPGDSTVVVYYPITGGTLPASAPTADPAATLTSPYAVAALADWAVCVRHRHLGASCHGRWHGDCVFV